MGTNHIELAWTDIAHNETGYSVDRSLDSNLWAQVTLTGPNVTHFSDIGLATNTLYYYRVAASNEAGFSAYAYALGRTWSAFDAWRYARFTGEQLDNSELSGESGDPDADGMSNWREYVAGTDPTNPASLFLIDGLPVPGRYRVRFRSAANRLYTLRWTTNLMDGVWFTTLGQVRVAGTGGPVELSDTNELFSGMLFYRVTVDMPDVQKFSEVSASAALDEIAARQADPDFVVLDVRTPGEYAARHIRGAIDLDFYAADFSARLDALDKEKTYLVYCRTGARSGVTYGLMRGLGFREVQNMLGGFQIFATLPGAEFWLEP